jgi:NADH-quinone oxidoreductase subunit H
MTGMQIVWTLIKILVMLAVVVNLAALLTWYDRRGSAMMQDRVGPNRAVFKIFGKEIRLAGTLHAAADGIKFFTKEDFMPPKADKLLFAIAPILAVASVLALMATIPFADTVCPNNLWRTVTKDGSAFTIFPAVQRYGSCVADPKNGVFPIEMSVAALNVGVLYVFAIAGQGIIGAAIAGWSSDNKFSLMGALRAASQMVSYEVTMGMSLIGAMMIYGSVRLDDMVRWQGENAWGIFVQPFAFFLFFTAAVAETKRIPFDLPEAESELVSGYFTEYSGMKFGMFYLAEYMEVVTSSMLIVTIFLGGWQVPFIHRDGITIELGTVRFLHTTMPHIWVTIIGALVFFGKVILTCWIQGFVRWSLPRFRYDQLMRLGWKILLPASLANILVTGVVVLAIQKAGPPATDALRLAGHITQTLIATLVVYYVGRIVVGMIGRRKKDRFIVGSSADQANDVGGTKESPMQA